MGVIDLDKCRKRRMLPFYLRKDLDGFIAYPWHYLFFSQFAWYRKLVGGVWRESKGIWIKMRAMEISERRILSKAAITDLIKSLDGVEARNKDNI